MGPALSWELIYDTGNSDHYPFCLAFNNHFNSTHFLRYRKYNVWKANWALYREKCCEFCTLGPITSYNQFNEGIKVAISAGIPEKNPQQMKRASNIWWTEECHRALNNRREALKNYKRNPSMDSFIEFRKKRAQARRVFRQTKKDSFRSFCESLTRETPLSSVWKTVKKFSNSFSNKRLCPSLHNNIPVDFFSTLTQPIFEYNLPVVQFRRSK